MPLSWNEIKQRAITFSKSWSDASRERAEAQTFWNEFFDVFGVRRRTVASFEEPVKNLKGKYDFIDVFWKGKLLAEHKSRGKDLSRANSQALDYVQSLAREHRDEEIPRYILLSDFARFALHDLEEPDSTKATLEFDLADFHRHVRAFAFVAGYETRKLDPEDDANFRATELLAHLHDTLEEGGYAGHDLERFLVRVLFCLFAEDTGIFNDPNAFGLFVTNHTRPDGSDLGPQLAHLFQVLNTPRDKRQKNLDEDLAALPYVNGDLFAENLAFPIFTAPMRTALLGCSTSFHWEKISPAVFGSLFQSVMQPRERRQIGAHYTSERDILKLIRSLFLDDLRAEFDSIKTDKKALEKFHRKLASLNFLDPACGCGNFLVISYRELRRLEMDLLNARFGPNITEADVRAESRLNVSQFYGIEIEEWPARIAEVAMWLMDHQMNQELFQRFSQIKPTTPLTKSPHILHANALREDWNSLLPANECSYVLGNPPFVGKKEQDAAQKSDMASIWDGISGAGILDYVTCWYLKAVQFIADGAGPAAFVSTSSIAQGEQVGVLWQEMFRRATRINFTHRTFSWTSEARGRAHVHVVIIGFHAKDAQQKRLFDYDGDPDHPTISTVKNISPYLVEGGNTVVLSRRRPLCNVPEMVYGSFALDDGNYTLSSADRNSLVAECPDASQFIRRFVGGQELLHNEDRYCLWLADAAPSDLRAMPAVLRRVEAVQRWRAGRGRETTRELAQTPTLFAEVRQPSSRYLAIPTLSSEKRRYIPVGFLSPDIIASNQVYILPRASNWHFGILHSATHMTWVRQVCGRLESRYRYSNAIVYNNNFPWPQSPTDKQKERVEHAAQAVLDARAAFPTETLPSLYNPLTMPPPLAKAHADLDTAVDRCYRPQPFPSDRHRFEFLLSLYEQLTAPLTSAAARPRRRRTRT